MVIQKDRRVFIAVNRLNTTMRITDITEAHTGVLYHLTSVVSAGKMVAEDRIKLTAAFANQSEREAGSAKQFFMSTTRSKIGGYTLRSAGSGSAALVLDGQAISSRYRVLPVEYWGMEWTGRDHRYDEMEERVYHSEPYIPGARRYIREIHVLFLRPVSYRGRQGLLEIKRAGVPVYLYKDENDFVLQNKAKSVSLRDIGFEKNDSPRHYMSYDREATQKQERRRNTKAGKPHQMTYGLSRWVFLMTTPTNQWEHLHHTWQSQIRRLSPGGWGRNDSLSALDADLHNARTNPSEIGPIAKLMRKHNLRNPKDILDYIYKRWEPELNKLTEATSPYEKKLIDPALLTWNEYEKIVNPDYKSHPSDAYDSDVEDLNRYDTEFETLLNRIKVNGLRFQVRMKTEDRWNGNYYKMGTDREYLRNDKGNLIPMSRDEIAAMIPDRYRNWFAIVDERTGKIVGRTQDEWGTILLRVAREYRGFGFGELLLKLQSEKKPDYVSGGFTPSGRHTARKVHAGFIRDYLKRGMYSYLVQSGQISMDRVKAITQDLGARSQRKEQDFDTTDPRDWLLMTDMNSYAIIYNQKLFDLEDPDGRFSDDFIIGAVMIGSFRTDDTCFIGRIHGSDRIRAYLLELIMNFDVGGKVRLTQSETNLLPERVRQRLGHEKTPGRNDPDIYWLKSNSLNLEDVKALQRAEQIMRKRRDKHDEFYYRIQEKADSLGRP